MRADPAVLYAEPARRRCLAVAQAIVAEIQTAPATPEDTHTLEMGYRAVVEGTGAEIVTSVRYWRFVEFGTGKMRARPHVRPAIETIRQRGVP